MLSTSVLSSDQRARIADLASGLDAQALTWLSGYFAGVAETRDANASLVAARPAPLAALPESPARRPATVLYGSQTGNAKRQAEQLAQRLEQAGLAATLVRADAYNVRDLKLEQVLYIVISTQGDGDPPDDAMAFVEFLNGRRAPKLPNLHYAVLGLGDSSYPEFCGIARKIDARLAELGGQRLEDVATADLDIETIANPWTARVVEYTRALQPHDEADKATGEPLARGATVTPLHARSAGYHRDNPFQAELLLQQRITGRGSSKDIRHIELSLESSHLSYEPGDTLGIWPVQSNDLVERVLIATKLDGNETVTLDGEAQSLSAWLTHHRELTILTRPFVQALADRHGSDTVKALLTPERQTELRQWLDSRQLIDALQAWPVEWSATELLQALRPLSPRLYSIASAQSSVGDEVHLTVGQVAYEQDGEARWGAATQYLASLEEGQTVPVFIEENTRFRLPQDDARDIIMIGPGTGVAPFRAFVQERAESGATGRNWLFFGNPHFHTDFLYQTEWQKALANGTLHRLDLAFSRDQAEKIYVQNRLREQARDVYAWIQDGAHVYVCGDATHMARDVHQALIDIAVQEGGQSEEQAREWLADLAAQGRYARDVY